MSYIVGVDEVGRGPLAGPVTVCAVFIKRGIKLKTPNRKLKLKDSKQLTENQRNEWMKWVREMKKTGKIRYIISHVSPKVIDKINISRAANLAVERSLVRLYTQNPKIKHAKIFLDGGLFPKKEIMESMGFKTKTVIHGDTLIPIISLASVIAKVTRDRKMRKLAITYPEYHFKDNVGYGTKAHIRALKKHGYTDIHRLTFIGKFVKMNM